MIRSNISTNERNKSNNKRSSLIKNSELTMGITRMIGLISKPNKERQLRDHEQTKVATQLSKRVVGHSKKVTTAQPGSTFSEPVPRKTTQFNAPRDSFSQHKRVSSSGHQSLHRKKEITKQVHKRNTPSLVIDMEEDENPDSEDYSDYEANDEELIGQEVENESGPEANSSIKNNVQKRTRGPTSCMEIHAREMDERHTITVNEFRQPIGEDKKFSSFLGTVARNNKFAPLNYLSWKDVPMEKKEDIWNYINAKYVVPNTCKKWVLEAVHNAWKGHKSRTKTLMNQYTTRREKLANRPKTIPIGVMEVLLNHWDKLEVKVNNPSIVIPQGMFDFLLVDNSTNDSTSGAKETTTEDVMEEGTD